MLGFALLLRAAASAPVPGAGPDGPPTGLYTEQYGSPTKVRVGWSTGDASAYSRVYNPTDGALIATKNPGVLSHDTGLPDVTTTLWVSHYKNGQESAKVSVVYTAGGGE